MTRHAAAIHALWNRMKMPNLPQGEVIELQYFDCNPVLVSQPPDEDGWWVTAYRHRPYELGAGKRMQTARVLIPMIEPHYPAEFVDHVIRHLQLLIAMLTPQKPPKGWRLFGRRPK